MGEADGRDELIEGIEIQDLGDLRRTDGCGDISEELLDREVMLMGWVARRRDLGSLIFLDLRDRSGIVQVVSSHPIPNLRGPKRSNASRRSSTVWLRA